MKKRNENFNKDKLERSTNILAGVMVISCLLMFLSKEDWLKALLALCVIVSFILRVFVKKRLKEQ